MEVSKELVFLPRRRLGFLFHFAVIGLLLALIGYGLWGGSRAGSSLAFLLNLLPALAAGALLPLFGYRLYSLQTAGYTVSRDGLRLRWGWRVEEIPSNVVEWVGPARKYDAPLPSPLVSWPGAVTGMRRMADGRPVEYFADRRQDPVLIVTPQQVYAISPADQTDFLLAYQRLSEQGSLTPLAAQSIYPELLLRGFQADLTGQLLVLGNILLALALFVVVALGVPSRQQVSLRFTPGGEPLDYIPAVRLFLLPVLNLLALLADGFLGMAFYRREELRPLAYLLWATGVITAVVFLGAVIFILRAS
jgi:hypothetical protein